MIALSKVVARRFNIVTKIMLYISILAIFLVAFAMLFRPSLGYTIKEVAIACLITAGVLLIRWIGLTAMRVTGAFDSP